MSREYMADLLAKLRPLLKDDREAERLWHLWLVEEREGREWIEQMLEIEYNRLVKPFEKQQLLLPPPSRAQADGVIELGTVMYNDKPLYPVSLPNTSALLQHTGVFGRSGAGKTNFLFKLLSELDKQHIPFWIFDWKRDYRPLLSQTAKPLVFTVGRAPSSFPFNPLMPPPGADEDIERYIGKVIDVIGRAFYVGHGVKALLSRAFHSLVQQWKQDPSSTKLTFQAALQWMREHNPSASGPGRRASDWKESTIRALEQLCMGQFGRSLNVYPTPDLDALLGRSVIFELDGLTNDQKFFFTEALLLWLREHALARLDTEKKDQLRLMLVIEEAHHLLKTGQEKNVSESVLEVTLRETRSLGMGIVVIDQTPSLISKVALSNLFTSIYFSLQGRSNVMAAADALLLDEEQREFLGRLPVGRAVCKMQDHWVEPFLMEVPLMRVKQAVVSDRDVTEHMKAFRGQWGGVSGDSGSEVGAMPQSEVIPLISAAGKKGITDAEKAFLVDVLKRPFVGMANRYQHLGVSTRHGNDLRQKLEAAGLVAVRHINTGNAQVRIPELTDKAIATLTQLGYRVERDASRGSLEHRYWVHRVAEHYQHHGFAVTVEKELAGGKRVDVEAVKGDVRIAIEVETGSSSPRANLAKLARLGYTQVVLVPTSPEATRYCDAATRHGGNVSVAPTATFGAGQRHAPQ